MEDKKKKLGNDWWRLFKKRHPELTFKKGEKTDPKRLNISLEAISTYFENLKKIKSEYNIPNTRILNADETGVPLSPDSNSKTIGIRGKSLYIRGKETREQITTLVTISSGGDLFTPLFIYRGKTFPLEQAEQLPPNVMISAAPKGFITGDLFAQWIAHIVEEAKVTIQNPAILIVDAHQSRMNLDALETAKKSGLHIVVLPGGSTSFLQPLDKAIFKVFKQRV